MALLVISYRADAGPVLRLSSPSDLNNLTVDQTVRIDVELADVGGRQLELLAAGVGFDPDLFGTAGNVDAGEVVPDAGDPSGFAPSTDPGFVDVIFEATGESGADRITGNGRFFSFDLTATAAGSGEVSFDFAEALAFNAEDPFFPNEVDVELGDGLSVRVNGGGGTVIPLPPGLAMGLLGMGGVVAGQTLRARGLLRRRSPGRA